MMLSQVPPHSSRIFDYPDSLCVLAAGALLGTHTAWEVTPLTKDPGCQECRSQLACSLMGTSLSVISAIFRISLQDGAKFTSLGFLHFPVPYSHCPAVFLVLISLGTLLNKSLSHKPSSQCLLLGTQPKTNTFRLGLQ
jgi:hypothetical protein